MRPQLVLTEKETPCWVSTSTLGETPGKTHPHSNGSQHLNGEEMRGERVTVIVLNQEKVVPKRKAGRGLWRLGSTDDKGKRRASPPHP